MYKVSFLYQISRINALINSGVIYNFKSAIHILRKLRLQT